MSTKEIGDLIGGLLSLVFGLAFVVFHRRVAALAAEIGDLLWKNGIGRLFPFFHGGFKPSWYPVVYLVGGLIFVAVGLSSIFTYIVRLLK